jgi:hypothetical protein
MIKLVKQEIWPVEVSVEEQLILSKVSDILDNLSAKMAEYELTVIEDNDGDEFDDGELSTAIHVLEVLRYATNAH